MNVRPNARWGLVNGRERVHLLGIRSWTKNSYAGKQKSAVMRKSTIEKPQRNFREVSSEYPLYGVCAGLWLMAGT
jgi:hypothetical protein